MFFVIFVFLRSDRLGGESWEAARWAYAARGRPPTGEVRSWPSWDVLRA